MQANSIPAVPCYSHRVTPIPRDNGYGKRVSDRGSSETQQSVAAFSFYKGRGVRKRDRLFRPP